MGLIKRNLVFLLFIGIVFAITGISCNIHEAIRGEDAFALWREQPNERLIFMSRLDSPEGELYSLDKNGQISRLTWNNRHENNPAISPDGKNIAFNAGDEGNMLTWEIFTLDLLISPPPEGLSARFSLAITLDINNAKRYYICDDKNLRRQRNRETIPAHVF